MTHLLMMLFCLGATPDAGASRDGGVPAAATSDVAPGPSPLLGKNEPVDWWFAFKFNNATFPDCGKPLVCPFGGTAKDYKLGEQFAVASSREPQLKFSGDCLGERELDPLGATFGQVYDSSFFFVLWNDQFYDDPKLKGDGTWGHSKGMLAWNADGVGFVLQVSTPSWPAAGSRDHPRKDGNTLGCVNDDNVLVSQHFFALKLTKQDLLKVLAALRNASVIADPHNLQVAKNGGPKDVVDAVNLLGKKSDSKSATREKLSTGVLLISKPSKLNVPPWHLVSSLLKGTSLRTATWWAHPEIPSTTESTPVNCWADNLGKPGAVDVATSGQWAEKSLGFKGTPTASGNHAKVGVTTSGTAHEVIFGDMNQQGTLNPDSKGKCDSSQNGRGGLFYVVENAALFKDVTKLLAGESAPGGAP